MCVCNHSITSSGGSDVLDRHPHRVVGEEHRPEERLLGVEVVGRHATLDPDGLRLPTDDSQLLHSRPVTRQIQQPLRIAVSVHVHIAQKER